MKQMILENRHSVQFQGAIMEKMSLDARYEVGDKGSINKHAFLA